jgi:nitroreductase
MSHVIAPGQLVAALNWRYAVKKFDPAKTIPAETWNALEQSLVLTPSSMGMQPWKFFVVSDPETKSRLLPAAKNQPQTIACSHFVVFAVHRDLGDPHVNRHLDRMAEVRGIPRESLDKFLKMAMGNLDAARTNGTLDTWQKHQVYIALGTFMAAAALLGVDTCPMEGIDPPAMDEILGMSGTEYETVVACAAGYRASDDKYAAIPKVRFKSDDVIVRI